MAFSTTTVTHNFLNANGTPASGDIVFTLTNRMTNGSLTMIPASVTAKLDNTGHLASTLTSNLDPGTVPQSARWRVDMHVLGAEEETFFIQVPVSGGLSIDLGFLLPDK